MILFPSLVYGAWPCLQTVLLPLPASDPSTPNSLPSCVHGLIRPYDLEYDDKLSVKEWHFGLGACCPAPSLACEETHVERQTRPAAADPWCVPGHPDRGRRASASSPASTRLAGVHGDDLFLHGAHGSEEDSAHPHR